MKLTQDDFTEKTKQKLRDRVNALCSKPDCRRFTQAPAGVAGVNNLGEAAHINGARPGSARYDETMTSAERRHITNGIWLCRMHAREIDNDELRFPESMLQEWKRTAEEQATADLGRRAPSNSDAIDTLTTALTGHPKRIIASAIENVHKGASLALESLDDRFLINTSYSGGQTYYEIHGRENVPMNLKATGPSATEFSEKFKQLISHGADLTMRTEGLSFEGSPLFKELINNEDGLLTVSAAKIAVVQKLVLTEPTKKQSEPFEDISGDISIGRETCAFSGSTCGGHFRLSYQLPRDLSADSINISISISLDEWEGKLLNRLPYLEKLLLFFRNVLDGWEVTTTLELEGRRVFLSNPSRLDHWDFAKEYFFLLSHIANCAVISEKFNLSLRYSPALEFAQDEYNRAAEVAQILRKEIGTNASSICTGLISETTVDENLENLNRLTDLAGPVALKIIEPPSKIKLLGTTYPIPAKTIYISAAQPQFNFEPNNLKPGDKFEVEWVPEPDSQILISYTPNK